MNLFPIIKMALREIKSNKLRSFLTILGISIGTASVILFVTISIGSKQSMYKSFESKPLDLITISVYGDKKISEFDLKVLKGSANVKEISPEISESATVSYDKKDSNRNIVGTDENYAKLNNRELQSGRFIMPIDDDKSTKIAVLGSKVASDLFPSGNALGKTINIKAIPYKIIGVLNKIDESYESPEDDNIYIPFKTSQVILGLSDISKINVKASSNDTVKLLMSEIKTYFNKKGMGATDFYMSSNKEMLESMKSMDDIMNLMVGAIASVSLFVAGIGIMNMMLVSVTERTKEIGIRKALGCPRKFILTQFLVESLTISFIGSIIGSLIGIFGSMPILNSIGAESYIAWNVVFVAVGFAVFMGVIFGISPANKASKLQPIVALKSE
ncbi:MULTISPECIES: ABC transporter permease [unclassified Clostridioides]|uniref:ABC transporter permease n=1 Tax=unclassified Clostridioides TaxID=2635829 RepID=UPI001D109A9F|nr:ABC transporter permease [Clostridioides sp. ES-S-0171-01]MCC0687282.1 ABC transporter permease [Clostridioides sp. ES-S-0056-01]UDN56157.1 ABC transporter permease [Clostridioides sp. ES-S-0054-01]